MAQPHERPLITAQSRPHTPRALARYLATRPRAHQVASRARGGRYTPRCIFRRICRSTHRCRYIYRYACRARRGQSDSIKDKTLNVAKKANPVALAKRVNGNGKEMV